MRRRRFLFGLAGLATTAAALMGWRYRQVTAQEAIVSIVRDRLHYLRIDPDGLRRFAADVLAAEDISHVKLRSLVAAGPLARHLPLPAGSALAAGIAYGEDRLVSEFLLSSDFFSHGRDVARVVRYVARYDPIRPCGNPFARPPLDA